MEEKRMTGVVMLAICAVVGVLSALATRKFLVGVGMTFGLFVAWEMWKYIGDIGDGDNSGKK